MTNIRKLVTVKPLEWQRGIVDYAKPTPGMKYVACSTTPAGSWAWWLDEASETREVHGSEKAAKAAAQADYEARILAALQPTELVGELVEAAKDLGCATADTLRGWTLDDVVLQPAKAHDVLMQLAEFCDKMGTTLVRMEADQ
jgi:hypothetical protein